MEERRRKPPDRVATCEVEERLSVEEWGAERLFPPLASHFSTWTAPGVVTRKREALKVADVSWVVMGEIHGERNRQTQPIIARAAGITTKRARFKCHGSSCLMGGTARSCAPGSSVYLDVWTPDVQLINQILSASQMNLY